MKLRSRQTVLSAKLTDLLHRRSCMQRRFHRARRLLDAELSEHDGSSLSVIAERYKAADNLRVEIDEIVDELRTVYEEQGDENELDQLDGMVHGI